MGVGGQRHALVALPPGKTWYPLYSRLGGPQGRSGRVWKISPPPGFDPGTAQLYRLSYPYNVINNITKSQDQLDVETVTTSRYVYTDICISFV